MKKEKKPTKGFMDGYKKYNTSKGFGNVHEWRAAWNERMGHQEAATVLERDDPLSVLGFDTIPSKYDLDKRYRELVMKHHPDRGGEAQEFKRVQAAWSLLSEKI
jgi:hypothetical protein